jgi:3-isopropylmalate/(R)-2-methylmalate dehydratase large subunit
MGLGFPRDHRQVDSGAHTLGQAVGTARRTSWMGWQGAALHRPPSLVRGHQPASDGLRAFRRKPWRADSAPATVDHNVPTTDRSHQVSDPLARIQIDRLEANARDFGIKVFGLNDPCQGIIHIIGPEQGATPPGMTVVAGDSHTSTHGALAALALGIGTSEVEHVLATQCLWLEKPKSMRIASRVSGEAAPCRVGEGGVLGSTAR